MPASNVRKRAPPSYQPPVCRIQLDMTGISEDVIREMERLLQRALTPEEIRLLLLANVIEEDLLEGEKPALTC